MHPLASLFFCFLLFFHSGLLRASGDPIVYSSDRLSNVAVELKSLISRCDCIIALGEDGLAQALTNHAAEDKPIFVGYISRSGFYNMGGFRRRSTVFALYDEPSPEKQLILGKSIIKSDHIRILYSDRSQYLLNSVSSKYLLKSSKSQLRNTLSKLQFIDSIIMVPDSHIWNRQSFKLAALSLYRRNKILIGFSKTLVEAGAMAALYYTEGDYKAEFVRFIHDYKENRSSYISRYPLNYRVFVNRKLAHSINLYIPSDDRLLELIDEEASNGK